MVIHDGGISLSVRNDASFIVDARLSIYEPVSYTHLDVYKRQP